MKRVKIELTEYETTRIICCLFREVLDHDEQYENYKKQGLMGIAFNEKMDAMALMKIRTKLQKATNRKEEGK